MERLNRLALAALLVLTLLFGSFAGQDYVFIGNLTLIAVVGAVALTVLTGVAGQVSMGHGALFCIGAFLAAIVVQVGDVPFPIVLLLSLIVGGIAGFVAGLPSLRLTHFYLALSTLALHFITLYIFTTYQYSGPQRETGYSIPTASVLFVDLDSQRKWFAFLLCVAALIVWIGTQWMRSKPGRAWIAVKDNEVLASLMGVDVARYKLLAFVATSALVCLAGTLSAYQLSRVTIVQYTLWIPIVYYAMVIVGGLGSIPGAVVGAIVINILPYLLTGVVDVVPSSLAWKVVLVNYKAFLERGLFGVLIIAFLWLEPNGLVALARRASNTLRLTSRHGTQAIRSKQSIA